MNKNPFAGLPNNKFGNAFDLSSLKAPAAGESTIAYGKEVTQANLVSDFVKESNNKVVILLCWSPRSAQAKEILEILGKLESADQNAWLLGTVNVDTQAAVAQALQVQSVPVAIAIIQEQMIPLFESVPPLDQVRLVINKLLELAVGKGIGKAPENSAVVETPMEPEEEAAYAAMEKGDYAAAKAAYQSWLKRKPNDPVATIGLAQADLMNRINGLDFS
jgi:putative thioredoxin